MKCLATLVAAALAPCVVCATTYYVDANRPNDSGSGLSWAAAKKTIQAAVDASAGGDTVLVSNGVYATGQRVTPGAVLSNRVVLTKAVRVRSVGGPLTTTIQGAGPLGPGAIRCVYLSSNAALEGFTLMEGHTCTLGGWQTDCGAGAYIEGSGLVSNCIVYGCVAYWRGGGVMCRNGGEIVRCTISQNEARESLYAGGGGVALWQGSLRDSLLTANKSLADGGGVWCHAALVSNSTIRRGTAAQMGGGIYAMGTSAVLRCVIANNVATNRGGGLYLYDAALVRDSVITQNTAMVAGGGLCAFYPCVVQRCVVRHNTAYGNGGGIYLGSGGTVFECELTGNLSTTMYASGGALYAVTNAHVRNCLIAGNTAAGSYLYENCAGVHVADFSRVESCTICSNRSHGPAGLHADTGALLNNSIIWYNTGYRDAVIDNHMAAIFYANCTPSLWVGALNITNDPQFIAGTWYPAASSPCIDAGTNLPWMAGATDLAGNPRIYDGRADMGCYEFIPEPAGLGLLALFTMYNVHASISRRRGAR